MINSNQASIQHSRSDEISVKLLLLKLIAYTQLLLKYWYLILLSVLALGGYNYYHAAQLIDTFPAKIKLFVNHPKVDKNNTVLLEGLSKLMNTQQILLQVFLKPLEKKGFSNSIVNSYLNAYYALNPKGLSEKIPQGFQFREHELSKMSQEERFALSEILKKVQTPLSDYSDGFVSISGDFKLGFITLNVSTPSGELSILLVEELYAEIKEMLLGKAVYARHSAFSNLSIETDSLAEAYKKVYYDLNKYKDRRGRLLEDAKDEKSPDKSPDKSLLNQIKYLEKKIHRLSAEAEISKTGYLAALEQQKVAQLDRDQNRISVEVLERSFSPIEAFRPSVELATAKGGIMGGIGMSVLLIFIAILGEVRKELFTTA